MTSDDQLHSMSQAPSDDSTTQETSQAELTSKVSIAELLDHMPQYESQGYHWYVYRIPRLDEKHQALFTNSGLWPYIPMETITTRDVRGNIKRVRRPRLLNYVFALGRPSDVDRLRYSHTPTCPLFRRKDSTQRLMPAQGHAYQTIPYRQMDTLIRYTESSTGDIRIIMADDELLDKGDRVRVIKGPMTGMEGILRTSQGKRGGEVFITLTHSQSTDSKGNPVLRPCLGLQSIHLDERYIKIIEFAPGTTHFYKKIQSFEHILDEAIAQHADGTSLSKSTRDRLEYFIDRYDQLQNLSRINAIKLAVACHTANILLGKTDTDILRDLLQMDIAALPASARQYIEQWEHKLHAPKQ